MADRDGGLLSTQGPGEDSLLLAFEMAEGLSLR